MAGGLIQSGNYGRPKRPHTRTSTMGRKFSAGRGKQPTFYDANYMSIKQKIALWNRFKMFLNALAKPSTVTVDGDGGSCSKNIYNAFSKGLYEHSHLHLGHIAHYNRLGYCDNFFTSYSSIEEYMDNLENYSSIGEWDYEDLNIAMYKLWLTMKQKIKWAWM